MSPLPSGALYDDLGRTYLRHRRADPAIAARLRRALDDARTVLNVGAGTGSYEPPDLEVVAAEPSAVMVAQRPPGAAPAVLAVAEALPFREQSFDAAMVVLSLHHWRDKAGGLAELRRVARRRVVLTFDVALEHEFWLVRDYLPEIARLDHDPWVHPERVAETVGAARIEPVPVPHDCLDGFLCAYWRRPRAYLDPMVRACISSIARLPQDVVERGVGRLAADLSSGRWEGRNADLLARAEMDWGYRLVVGER